MNVQLIVAGSLGIVAAALHGGVGEMLVLRKLSPQMLPSSRFGGPRTTSAMIHVTWHITTAAFLTVGSALLVAGSALDGDAARGISLVGAGAFTGFAAVALALGAVTAHSARVVFLHPGPIVLTAIAVLAWWGAL